MGMKVVVVHPDLGIGGAERLIIDLSLALQDSGFLVKIFTSYHDKSRCFEETKNGTLEVITVGQWIPRTILGKCHALMAYLKMIYIALYLMIFSRHDLVVCDQVSACIPVLRMDLRNRAKIVFYCHFPDQLLTERKTLLKTIYRLPLDWFEGWSTSLAHMIIVNSEFTRQIVRNTFKQLTDRPMQVLYPCVDIAKFVKCKPSLSECSSHVKLTYRRLAKDSYFVFLSLNRFERKKDLALAIRALHRCIETIEDKYKIDIEPHLIIAGGYDERLEDCVNYLDELKNLVSKLNLDTHVTFILSPSENEKLLILQMCKAVLYTPMNEHFGIVPLEAMAMSRPVIACNSGGPLETIVNEKTGYLGPNGPESFAEYMLKLVKLESDSRIKMGEYSCNYVKESFGYEKFRSRLESIFDSLNNVTVSPQTKKNKKE